jgi:hypothetical protein
MNPLNRLSIFSLLILFQSQINFVASRKCGTQNYVAKFMAGAEDAEEGQFPWKIAIFYGGHYMCGGSIIGRQHVLTG